MKKLTQGEVVDLNVASAEDVARIPQIGMKSAENLVAARPEGGFKDWGDVRLMVPGWGAFTIGLARPFVVFGSEPVDGAPAPEVTEGTNEAPEPAERPEEPKAKPKRRRTKAA